MSNKLYVSNLSYQTDESALRDAFGAHGRVTDVHLPTNRETGQLRGFAFVTFEDAASAKTAMDAWNGKELDGRSIRVTEARPRPGEDSGGGGGDPASPSAAPRRNFGPDRKPGAFAARYRNKR